MCLDLSKVFDESPVFVFPFDGFRMPKNGGGMDSHEDRGRQFGARWSASQFIEPDGLAKHRLGCRHAETQDDVGLDDL